MTYEQEIKTLETNCPDSRAERQVSVAGQNLPARIEKTRNTKAGIVTDLWTLPAALGVVEFLLAKSSAGL